MAQIRKGFIANNAIDGTKLKLLNNEAIRAANADGSDAELMKLDDSNVLQFLKMPQVSADPTDGNDVARKSYVDNSISSAQSSLAADLAAETAAREAADSAETAARESADSSLRADLNTEISDREAAVAAEASAREAADLAESSARTAADSAEQSAREAADSAEALARETADNALSARLDVVEGVGEGSVAKAESDAKAYADQKIADLVNSAPAVLDTLQELAAALGDDPNFATTVAGQIGDEATARAAADATEAAARQAADSAEQSAREAADLVLQSNINDEASARSSADQTLQSNIDAEAAARQSADSDEQAARIADVADLQSQIDALDSGSSAGLSTEIARAQAAEAALQAEIDAEETARADAISSEASSRESGDAAINSRIDALTVDDMTDVETSSKASGDLMEWDSATGQWKNVAPLPSAFITTVTVPGDESVVTSYTSAGNFNDGSGAALGIMYRPESNVTVTKVGLQIGATSNLSSGMTVTGKIYAVSSSAAEGNGISYNPADFTLVATSTNSLTPGDMSLYPAFPEMEYFTFDNVELISDAYYIVWAEVDGASFGSSTPAYLAPAYSVGNFQRNHFKQFQQDGLVGGDYNITIGHEVFTGSGGSSYNVPTVGVIKTNTEGMLDSSFLNYDVSFGGHTLQGVATPSAGTDAANKDYVDSAVGYESALRDGADVLLQSNIDAEASAREAAVSSEASARESADATLQSNIDAEQAAREAAVSAEQSAREAADAGLQDQIDTEKGRIDAILLASDADKDSFAEIVQLINSVDTENDSAFAGYVLSNDAALAQEVSDRQAADSALDGRVDALEAVQHRKEKFTLTSTNISNGYIDLSMECIANSEFVFVGSLYVHSGDDYTVSTVGGKTRLTFAGELTQNGPSKLMVGDVVYVRYTK